MRSVFSMLENMLHNYRTHPHQDQTYSSLAWLFNVHAKNYRTDITQIAYWALCHAAGTESLNTIRRTGDAIAAIELALELF